MTPDDGSDGPDGAGHRKGDHYSHGDGTDEIVFAVDEGHVLAIREYRSVEDFERAVEDAEHVGVHGGVADLPGVEAFEPGGTDE